MSKMIVEKNIYNPWMLIKLIHEQEKCINDITKHDVSMSK